MSESKGVSVQQLKQTIAEATQQIAAIQEACTHPPLCITRKPRVISRDPGAGGDEYVYDCTCALCEKKWAIPQR